MVASTGLYKWVDRVEGRRWSWKLCKELGESLQRKVGRALEVATGRARYVDCTAKAARTVWRQAGGYAVVDAGLMLGVDVVRHVRALAGWQGVRELEVDEDGVPVLPPKSKVPGNWQFLANSFVQAGMRVAGEGRAAASMVARWWRHALGCPTTRLVFACAAPTAVGPPFPPSPHPQSPRACQQRSSPQPCP